MNGPLVWQAVGTPSPVRDAIVRKDSIHFDVRDDAGQDYSVTLSPSAAGAPSWRGTWQRRQDRASGTVTARLYASSDEELPDIVLVGSWSEGNESWFWCVELRG